MLNTTPTGFWRNSNNIWYLALGIVIALVLWFIAIPAMATEMRLGNQGYNNQGGITLQLGNERGNLDARGQRRFRDTDCELNTHGRFNGHDRLQGFRYQHCNRDNQGYFRGHQRRFTPTRWDVDGDGVPNRRDDFPRNPYRN